MKYLNFLKISVISMVLGFSLTPFMQGNMSQIKPDLLNASPILFTPNYQIENNPYFDWVINESDDSVEDFEKAKIEYLIERMRISPYVFLRNGNEHTSKEAAEHVSWKYRKAKGKIRTASDFITGVASRSFTTGKLYMTKLLNGSVFPVGDILTNELTILESELANQVSISPNQQ